MATKAQHSREYRHVPKLLRAMREDAELTQRQMGQSLNRPQSWVHNCETGNRRVDVAEFCAWAEACKVDPQVALRRFLASSR